MVLVCMYNTVIMEVEYKRAAILTQDSAATTLGSEREHWLHDWRNISELCSLVTRTCQPWLSTPHWPWRGLTWMALYWTFVKPSTMGCTQNRVCGSCPCCLFSGGPCNFLTFIGISVAMHMTAHDVHMTSSNKFTVFRHSSRKSTPVTQKTIPLHIETSARG